MVVSIVVRLQGLNAPVADWHSWRQADTAAVARNFMRLGIDVLHPRYDDLSNIQSGKDNPQGWRMVEMPLYQATAVLVWRLFPNMSIESVLRLVSVLSVAFSILLLGLLLREFIDEKTAMIGMFLYAILPFSIFYGRSILPDTFAVFWALLSLVFLARASTSRAWLLWVMLAGVSGGVSVLVRPMAVFLLLPGVYLLSRLGTVKQKSVSFLAYGLLVCIPLYFWRQWILQFPEGIAVSDWLYNKANIRFKGAWFYWLFAKRFGELILGYWGLILFGLGMIVKNTSRERVFSSLWFIGGLLYLVIFAGGNVQHDYYQALLIPVTIWFLAKGTGFLLTGQKEISKMGSIALVAVTIGFMWAFSWYTIRSYFWINRPEIIEAGKKADEILPKNAKIIAPYNGDTTFLYQANRQGWPLGFDIDKKISMGATHYVTVSPTDSDLETRDLANMYTVLVRNDTYAIIDLTKLNSSVKTVIK
jgi:hypothetical protein